MMMMIVMSCHQVGGERRAVRDAKEEARRKAIDSRSIYTAGSVSTLPLLNTLGPRRETVAIPGLRGIAIDPISGNFYLANQIQHTIHRVTPSGDITTVAGLTGQAGSTDETGARARFKSPLDIVMAPNGHLYVSDFGSHRIRKVTPDGVVTTIAGNGSISDNPKDGR
jgi:DNA-binding beta-propeller fold protein YncE